MDRTGLMKVFITLCAAIVGGAVIPIAKAQRPDCPMRDAPEPGTWPQPDFIPNIHPPGTYDGRPERRLVLPPRPDLLDVEEGYLAGLADYLRATNPTPPPHEIVRGLIDTKRTLLSRWQYHGYIGDAPIHKVRRVYSNKGSILEFEQWNMAADSATIAAAPATTVKIGRFLGNAGGFKTPSGCVSATLRWDGGGVNYSLKIAGPKSLVQQRQLLLDIARSIAAVTPGR